jgi:hypothetical protein
MEGGGPFGKIRVGNRNQSVLEHTDPFNSPKLKLDMLSPKGRSMNPSPRLLQASQKNDYNIKINITTSTQ